MPRHDVPALSRGEKGGGRGDQFLLPAIWSREKRNRARIGGGKNDLLDLADSGKGGGFRGEKKVSFAADSAGRGEKEEPMADMAGPQKRGLAVQGKKSRLRSLRSFQRGRGRQRLSITQKSLHLMGKNKRMGESFY